jgi:hypothetical protein
VFLQASNVEGVNVKEEKKKQAHLVCRSEQGDKFGRIFAYIFGDFLL